MNEAPRSENSSAKVDISTVNKADADSVKPFALSICREYLGGVWKTVSLDQFEISKLTGGLLNFIYKCSLKDKTAKPVGREPTAVLLRSDSLPFEGLYGTVHDDKETSLKEIVISAILGCQKLGPKPYGLFSHGRVEEFVEGGQMAFSDMREPTKSQMIARKAARFNSLEMPISKEPNWLFEATEKLQKSAREKVYEEENSIKLNQNLLSLNLENEFQELKRVLLSINSPVVFCHNDIQPTNILQTNDDVMIIDYEFGCYNYRGFEIGNHFCEWMFYNVHKDYPFFFFDPSSYPTRDQQLNFIRTYIEEVKSIRANEQGDAEDSNNKDDLDEEKLLKEANYFALASHLLWAAWVMVLAEPRDVTYGYLEYATARIESYFKLKSQLFPNGFN